MPNSFHIGRSFDLPAPKIALGPRVWHAPCFLQSIHPEVPMLWLILSLQLPAGVHDACSDTLEGCEAYALAQFSTHYTQALTAWTQQPDPSVQRSFSCMGGLDCLSWSHGTGRSYVRAPYILHATSAGGDRVRVTLLRQQHTPDAQGMVWMDGHGGVLEELSDEVVVDPELAALLDGPQVDAYWTESPHPDYAVAVLRGSDTWRVNQALEHPATVVCEDRIVRGMLPLKGLSQQTAGFYGEAVEPIYEYALPCNAELVLGGQISGPIEGPKPAASSPQVQLATNGGPATLAPGVVLETGALAGSHPMGETLSGCTFRLGELEASSSSWCRVNWVGDLNADGQSDIVFDRIGEMGCGSQQTWVSDRGGYKRISVNTWMC